MNYESPSLNSVLKRSGILTESLSFLLWIPWTYQHNLSNLPDTTLLADDSIITVSCQVLSI